MTDLRKAAEMALTALDALYVNDYSGYEISKHESHVVDEAIEALRQALAQEKEIEVWGRPLVELREALKEAEEEALAQTEQEPVAGMFEDKLPDQNPPPWVKDYKPKQWVGLTDEEMPEGATYEFDRGVRWAEAKLKEKNGG